MLRAEVNARRICAPPKPESRSDVIKPEAWHVYLNTRVFKWDVWPICTTPQSTCQKRVLTTKSNYKEVARIHSMLAKFRWSRSSSPSSHLRHKHFKFGWPALQKHGIQWFGTITECYIRNRKTLTARVKTKKKKLREWQRSIV